MRNSNSENIPKTWLMVTISDVVPNERNCIKRGPFGSSIKKEHFVVSGYKVYEQKNIIYNNFKSGSYYIDEAKFKELQDFELRNGDIVISCSGTIGKIAITPPDLEKGVINQALLKISLDKNLISTEYFALLFSSEPFQKKMIDSSRGSAMMNISSVKDLKEILFPIPPLPEQHRIVAKIDALFERSRRARQFLEAIPPLLEKFRQSVLAAAFRGDLTKEWREKNKHVEPASVLLERIRAERRKRWEEAELAKLRAKGREPLNDDWKAKYVEPEPVDTSDLPELPEGWEWASWETVGKCQNGRAFPSKFYQTDGVKLLRPGNLHFSGQLVWNDQNTTYMPESWGQDYPDFLVEANQLIINLTAQSLKDEFLGRVCLSGENEYCLLNQRLARLTPVEQLPVGFFLWLFKSPIFRQFVDGLNTGTLIQHMFTSQINKFYVPLPPLKEIEQIILEVEKRLETITAIKQYIESSTKQIEILNQSILAKAFRGELVPQDPNDEPASVLLERIKAERATNEEAKNGKKVKPKLAAKQKEQLQQSDVINQAQPSTANTPAKKDDEEEWEMVQLSLFDS